MVSISERSAAHAEISEALAELSDSDLAEVVGQGDHRRTGIGGSTHAVQVAGRPVFVKLVRLTELELAAGPGSTINMFDLPTWYQYGVGEGSAGFSAWRELAAHQAVSEWVRLGECVNFPLLHHWRILPQKNLAETASDQFAINQAVQFWGCSRAVEIRLRALAESSTVIALFVEYLPFVLRRWFASQLNAGAPQAEAAVRLVEQQLLRATGHMRSRGMSHFDVHFDNILTDGRQIYVSDFGLATSQQFQLDSAERDFFAVTSEHDMAYSVTNLVNAISGTVLSFSGPYERNQYLRNCSRHGEATNLAGLLADTVVRYASIATIVNDFYWELHDGNLSVDYPATAIAEALDGAGLVS